MLRSVIFVDLASQHSLVTQDVANKLLTQHPRGPNQPRFEDWAVEQQYLSKDAAQQLVQIFGQTPFMCMSCMTVSRGVALDGESDLRCPKCGRSAIKRADETSTKRHATARSGSNPNLPPPETGTQPGQSQPVPPTPVPAKTPFAQPPPADHKAPTRKLVQDGETTSRLKPATGDGAADTSRRPTPPSGQIRIELDNRENRNVAPDAKTVILNQAASAVQPALKPETSVKKGTPSERATGRIANWDILELAGQGGMGKVYKCYNPVLDRYTAVKVLENNKEKAIKRFRHEARTLARIDHPNVVRVFDFGEVDGKPYFVMEWVDGRTLFQLVTTQGPMPPLQVIDVGLQICAALGLAHELNIVHRDIKPENILLDINGRVKITDFGLATQEIGSNRITAPGTILGTPAYMAPEQIQQELGTPQTDIYALSVLLFFLLTGHEPFEGNNAKVMHLHLTSPFPPLASKMPNPPAGFDDLLQHMSAKRPLDRPRSIIEVAQALQVIRRKIDAAMPEHERLNIVGKLGSPEGASILETLVSWRDAGIRKIIIDLSQCSYLSSSALTRLGTFADEFEQLGGRVVFAGVPDHAKALVQMLAAKHKVRITGAFEEALTII